MTMPVERTRSLRWGWEFLLDLQASDAITPEQQTEVDQLLRHYPSRSEIRQWAAEFGNLPGTLLAPEDGSQDQPGPDEIARAPVTAIDRAAALIAAGAFFKTLRHAGLPEPLKSQLPYVLRHFPDAHEIVHLELLELQNNRPESKKNWLQSWRGYTR